MHTLTPAPTLPRQPDTHLPVYHYTTGDRFIQIARDGLIRPSFGGVEPPEIPAVWLSTAQLWEGSASKGVIANGQRRTATPGEMVRLCGCLVRIRINPAKVGLITAAMLPHALRIPETVFFRLFAAGLEMGANPADWRATAAPIPRTAWTHVEFAVRTNPIVWTPCGVP